MLLPELSQGFLCFCFLCCFPVPSEIPFLLLAGVTILEVIVVVVVAVVVFLCRLLFLAFSANLNLLYMPHPGMGPLV